MKLDHLKAYHTALFEKKYIVVWENNENNGSYNPFVFNYEHTSNGTKKFKPLRIGKLLNRNTLNFKRAL